MSEQVTSRQHDSMTKLGRLRVRAVLENVPLAIDCVTEWAQKAGFDDRVLYDIQLAVDEACANVVHHAYQGMERGDMEVLCSFDDGVFIIQVRDWGKSFEPDSVEEPDVDAPLEERTIGGLGLFLVKQVMDHVQFTFDPELGNELKMTKGLQVAG